MADIADGLSASHVRETIADGDAGTAQTIERMRKLVSKGKRDKEVRATVGKIVNGDYDSIPACGNKDHLCYAKSIYQFCKTKILYAFDPNLVEYIENPAYILRSRIADCDSIVGLLCSMYEGIGFPCQFVTIKADPQRPNEFSHVYCRVQVPNVGWVAVDATMPKKSFGWEAPNQWGKQYWHASNDDAGPIDDTPSVTLDQIPQNTAGAATMLSGLRGMRGLGCDGDTKCKTCSGTAGLGRMGDATQDTIYDIITGKTYSQIKDLETAYHANAMSLDATKAALDKMPPGPGKNRAAQLQAAGETSLRQQFSAYAALKDRYNSFITQARGYMGGVYNPSLAGLGIFGADDTALAIVALIAGVSALVVAADLIKNGMAFARGQDVNTKGFIDQISDAIKASGGAIASGGNTAIKLAIVGGIGFVGYLFLKTKGFLKHA